MIDFLNNEETAEKVEPVQEKTEPQKYKYVNLSGTILWTDAGKIFPNQEVELTEEQAAGHPSRLRRVV